MRIFKRVTIGMVLAGVAIPALSATVNSEDLASCKSALGKIYGEDTRLKLKSIKANRNGNQMLIQSVSAQGAKEMSTCWIDSEGLTHLTDGDGEMIRVETLAQVK